MRETEFAVAGTTPIVSEAHSEGGEHGREFRSVTKHIAAIAIVNVRRTAVLLTTRAAVRLLAGWTKMMRHEIFS